MRRELASYLSAAAFAVVAAGAAVTSQFGPVVTPGARAEIARVAGAIDSLPFIHATLIGRETEPMPAAVEMLRPERIVQRVYTDTESSDRFSLVIVFSPDARDLAGHYPPVCYPNAGWLRAGEQVVHIETGPHTIEAISYRFNRPAGADGSVVGTVATSFFIVPGNEQPFQSQQRAVEAAARDRRAAGLGAVHVMIGLDGDPDDAERARLLNRAGEVLSSMIDRIAN